VGGYGVETPWGLLDASGGAKEWMEMFPREGAGSGNEGPLRPYAGSSTEGYFPGFNPLADDLLGEYFSSFAMTGGRYGFRVGAAIPSPGAASLFALGSLISARRRR
jgi:hypothetical protein